MNRSKHSRRGRRWSVLRRRAKHHARRAWIRALVLEFVEYPAVLRDDACDMQRAIFEALTSVEKVPYCDDGIKLIAEALERHVEPGIVPGTVVVSMPPRHMMTAHTMMQAAWWQIFNGPSYRGDL